MMQAAQQHDRQCGDRLAVGPRLSVGRQRDLAQVEFQSTCHSAEGTGDRIDLDEVEANAVRTHCALLERTHQRRLAERGAENNLCHGDFTVG